MNRTHRMMCFPPPSEPTNVLSFQFSRGHSSAPLHLATHFPEAHPSRAHRMLPGLSVSLDSEATDVAEVLPRLFLGGKTAAKYPPAGVKRIVNATSHEPCHFQGQGIDYLHVDIDDNENAKISKYFVECSKFIADGLDSGGAVLVHCALRSLSCAVSNRLPARQFPRFCSPDRRWIDSLLNNRSGRH